MYRQHYITTERKERLLDYLGAILIGLILAAPIIVYLIDM